MQAIGRKVVPVVASVLELGIKVIVGVWLIPTFGYLIVCLTEPVIWTVCVAFLILVFYVQKPLDKIKQEEIKYDRA